MCDNKGHNFGSQKFATTISMQPTTYMRTNQVCINFNDRGCPEKNSHENKYKPGQTLKHICGGCLKKTNTEVAHSATGCGNGPFAALFRQR